jgi:hypothetical protein
MTNYLRDKFCPIKMKKYVFLIFCFLLFLSSACTFNKKEQASGVDYLQGKWSEDTVKNKAQLVSYQQHNFKFTCDSFYLQINSYANVNLNGGACYDKNSWIEYAKGYYQLVGDTLKLEGNFVSKQYKFKPERSCYRVGKYQENFILIKEDKGTQILIIKSLQTSLTHQLKRKEKGVCTINNN